PTSFTATSHGESVSRTSNREELKMSRLVWRRVVKNPVLFEPMKVQQGNHTPHELKKAMTLLGRVCELTGLDLLPEAQTAYERWVELERTRQLATQDDREQVAQQLASGDVELSDAARALVELERHADEAAASSEALRLARRRAAAAVWAAIKRHGERLIDELRPFVAETVDDSIETASTFVNSVSSPREAIAAGPEIAAAWSKCEGLYEAWRDVHGLLDFLRGRDVLPVEDNRAAQRHVSPAEYRYADTRHLRMLSGVERALHLYRAAQLGMQPGLYTSVEVKKRLRGA